MNHLRMCGATSRQQSKRQSVHTLKCDASSRPLAGMRVLDFTWMMAGPYCTRFLADLGAEVFKIEAPGGEIVRSRPPLRAGRSIFFGMLNCGKKSIALDLKNPSAQEAVRSLALQCDIVVESFRPGVMQRLGLDYEKLRQINHRLVYCSISGFGQAGPQAGRAAFAQVVQAASGHDLTQALYQDADMRPMNTGIYPADVLAGAFALSGILAALRHRDITGRGQQVDTSLMDGMLCLLPHQVADAQADTPIKRPVYEPLSTGDGYLMVAAITEKNFEGLLDAAAPGWRDANAQLAHQAARHVNWSDAMALVKPWALRHSAKECETILTAAGVPAAAYQSVAQAMADEQVRFRGTFSSGHDASGRFLVPNLPFRLSDVNIEPAAEVPEPGQHTSQVLCEIAGLGSQAIADALAVMS